MINLPNNALWTNKNKIIFRFLFVYFILYFFLMFFSSFFETPLRWFSASILGWESDFIAESTGSGDRTYDYVKLILNGILTVPIAIIWSVLDKKRQSYQVLSYWFSVILRFALFVFMLLYGFVKVFKGQFPDHGLERLLETVGEMSPMGLAWTFMGHSLFYNIFIGFAEILGGLLLLFRKTLVLGSCIIILVMSNVFMMNLTYDIPVKLFSFHLMLMAFVLLLPHVKRLYHFFFNNIAIAKVSYFAPKRNGTLQKIISFIKKAIVVLSIIVIVLQCFFKFGIRNQMKEKSKLYGIWETQLFIKNQDTLPPLLTDDYRWRYLIIDQKKKASVKKMTDLIIRYNSTIDTLQKDIHLVSTNTDKEYQFSYELEHNNQLHLKGKIENDSVFVIFQKKPRDSFRLINREFHWINETPFNK